MAEEETLTPAQLDDKQLLKRVRERLALMMEADEENRRDAKADIRFVSVPGAQWEDKTRTARGTRPCYEFDKLSGKAKRVINEMRANRPAGKVRAVEDTDKTAADVREGLCRNIANVSDLDTICDYAGVYQVEGGMGAWRVTTSWAGETMRQRIRAEPIADPFCLYWDPASVDPLKRDAEDWCLIDRMSKAAYTRAYGKKARKVNFQEGDAPTPGDWADDNTVRVCEYWYKEPYQKELWLLQDGKVIDAADPESQKIDPALVVKKRTAECHKIMMCIASGDAILEGPTEQAGKNHRFVVVHGEWKIVEGKPKWHGIVRKAKDAQRSYNVTRTAVTETIASAPNAQFWATPEMAKGNTDSWDRAQAENLPYMLANPDPKMPGFPQKMTGAEVPVALIQEMQLADQELKDITLVYDAALGERSNETSGVAIRNREQQTQLANFHYPDNMAKGVQRTWEIFNDLISEVYDTEQTIRVLGPDLAEDYVKVNTIGTDQETGQPIIVNDLTTGEFDITVTVGPSFATQRQEASEAYTGLAQSDPALMATAGDLVYKAMDLPYADEIAERRRAMLPPPIQQMLNKDKKMPPEVAQAMAQVDMLTQQIQQQGQIVQQAAAEAEKIKGEADKAVSDLNVKRAQFDADIEKRLAQIQSAQAALTQAEAQFALKQAQSEAATSSEETGKLAESLTSELQTAIVGLQQLTQDHLQKATEAIVSLQSNAQPQIVVAPAPRSPRVKQIIRQNGALVPVYEEEADVMN